MMAQVLHAVAVGRAQDREHAAPLGDQLIEEAIAKEHVMGRLVRQRRQPVLPGTDEKDAQERYGHGPQK